MLLFKNAPDERKGKKFTRFALLKISTIGFILASNGPSYALDCEVFSRMHGYASRAQFQCGFKSYNEKMINQARECAKAIGSSSFEQMIRRGMQLFDSDERNLGKTQACQKALTALPMVIRR